MPAKDRYHDTVKRALIKAGWSIIQDQVYLSDQQRHLWIDLSARRNDDETFILIEVKGFEGNASPMDAFMSAIGQYAVYQAMLDFLLMKNQLYLAIPIAAYEGILQAPVARQTIENLEVKLVIFNPADEDVLLWIP